MNGRDYLEHLMSKMPEADATAIDQHTSETEGGDDADWKRYDHTDSGALADYYDQLAQEQEEHRNG